MAMGIATRARARRWSCSGSTTAASSLPAARPQLERQDLPECFDGVDLPVVDLERFPDRELLAAFLPYAPGHAEPDDSHTLVDADHARRYVAEALEDRERLRRDVLAAGRERAVRTGHHLAVLVAIGV